MTRKQDWLLATLAGGLVITLLVCVCLLALPTDSNKTSRLALDVAQQEYKRELLEVDRKYEIKINRLQEQINSLQFIVSKQNDLLRDDVQRTKRDIDDIRERAKMAASRK